MFNIISSSSPPFSCPSDNLSSCASCKNISFLVHSANVSNYSTHSANISNYSTRSANVSNYSTHSANVSNYSTHSANVSNYSTHSANVLQELLHLSSEPKLDILNFDTKLLRLSAPLIAPILTHIYNLSLSSGFIPPDWKLARVTPVYKQKGSKHEPGNYRPISVVSPIAKIIEKSVKAQLLIFLSDHKLLSSSQSAYLKYHSTATALHSIVDNLLISINSNKISAACFIDLSKGFDTLNPEILLHKLKSLGIKDHSFNWFKSYLTHRKQIVSSNNALSQSNDLKMGVPQGTVLGPVLFLIYMNDLSLNISDSLLTMYADDTTVTCCGKTIDEACNKLNHCLSSISRWFTVNRLVINTEKSNFMIIGTPQKIKSFHGPFNIQINNKFLERVTETKLLGVYIDENLNFNRHVQYLTKKVSPKIALIHRLRNTLPPESLNLVYTSLIQSSFDYCLSVWGNSSKKNLTTVQRLQNRAARAVTGNFNFSSSVSTIINNLHWMPIQKRLLYFLGILVYKCLHGKAPTYLINTLNYVSNSHPCNTRNAAQHHLTVPHPFLSLFKQSFIYAGPTFWNSLPFHITHTDNLFSLKQKLKLYLKT